MKALLLSVNQLIQSIMDVWSIAFVLLVYFLTQKTELFENGSNNFVKIYRNTVLEQSY